MTPAFWDASALVPLCVQQEPTTQVIELIAQHTVIAWWGTSVEMRSALERLLRMRQLTASEYAEGRRRIEQFRQRWREVEPTKEVRLRAEEFVAAHALKAADSFQLSAAFVWSGGVPQEHPFICGDVQLVEAARRIGFRVIAV